MKKLIVTVIGLLICLIAFAETIVTDIDVEKSIPRKRFVNYTAEIIGNTKVDRITNDETYSKDDLARKIAEHKQRISDIQLEITRLENLLTNF